MIQDFIDQSENVMKISIVLSMSVCALIASACGSVSSSTSPVPAKHPMSNTHDLTVTEIQPTDFAQLHFLTEDDWIGLDFTNENRRIIWRTTDKGKTWTKVTNKQDANFAEFFSFINFVNMEVGFGVSRNNLLRTKDGGQTWVPIYRFSEENGSTPFFATEKIGWVSGATWVSGPTKSRDIGYEISILKTEDGGLNWIDQKIKDAKLISINSGGKGVIHDIFFLDEKTGWAAGYGVLLSTKNGGDNWDYEPDVSGVFDSVDFVDNQTGWLRERWLEESYFTTNAGKSWQGIKFPNGNLPRGSELILNREKQFVVTEPNGRVYLFDPHTGKESKVRVESERWNRIAAESFHNPFLGRTLDGRSIVCVIYDSSQNEFLSIESSDEGKSWH